MIKEEIAPGIVVYSNIIPESERLCFDIEEGILQVSVTHFKKYLAELQVSSSNFEREMKQVYIGGDTKKPRLIGSVRSRLNKGWKGSGGGGNVWCYHFNPEEIDGLFSKDTWHLIRF